MLLIQEDQINILFIIYSIVRISNNLDRQDSLEYLIELVEKLYQYTDVVNYQQYKIIVFNQIENITQQQ
ncbi:unnamed protein product [Paramecium pentaurelia]|uniref:Uncharacterized protein n=1 Tax=Paramecium pentaurelia TaxID=43138 RepID=A0A8S1Y4R6_9CILI|nr:unnamed protein product [Paramecium pentaurelia]